jgi:hypothetical protein
MNTKLTISEIRANLKPIHRKRIQLWVDALRSGKYKQGYFKLCDNTKCDCLCNFKCYCVLGVAFQTYSKYAKKKMNITKLSMYLNAQVSKWFFNTSLIDDPPVYYYHKETRCIILNDDLRVNFNELANAIETTYLF